MAKASPKGKSKLEIDRELLYQKIMPSASMGEEGVDLPGWEEPPIPAAQTAATPVNTTPAAVSTPQRPGETAVTRKEKDRTVLINLMEKLVLEKLDAAFSKFNCCKCDRCRQDVVALALNKLKPKYVVLPEDKPHPHLQNQVNAEVTTALVQAIITVRAHPRH